MWRRLNFANRTRETLAGNPSPPPEDEFRSRSYEIPSLDFHSPPDPPSARHAKALSNAPTVAASSVYSQPAHSRWLDDDLCISPPESPCLSGEHRDDGRVSPVEEHAGVARRPASATSEYDSYVPIPRKPSAALLEPRSTIDLVLGAQSPNSTGQVTPGKPHYMPANVEKAPSLSASSFEASRRGVFVDKASRLAGRLAKPREPWKGTGGRTGLLVDPVVNNTPQTPKLAIPPRHSVRPGPPHPPSRGDTLGVSHTDLAVFMRPNRDVYVDTPTGTRLRSFTAPPADDGEVAHDFDFITARPPHQPDNSLSERLEHEDTLAALLKRRSELGDRERLDSRFSWSTHATGTTHRTTQSHEVTEPPSPPPSMPTARSSILRKSIPASDASPSPRQASQPSMLERRRPIPKDDLPTTPKLEGFPDLKLRMSTMRKPVGATSPGLGLGISTNPSTRPGDATSLRSQSPSSNPRDKDLPLAPSILSSTKDMPADHVELLRKQIDDLAHRRNNVQRAVHNLTRAQSTNQNPMLTDWRTARESERRIQGLRDELADISREDHELGLKLHRAYKRREREGEMAGTSALWVRRVTG